MIFLQYQLVILCTQGSLLILVEGRKRQIPGGYAPTALIEHALVLRLHLLHQVSGGELEGVTILISHCHRHELIFLDFYIQYFLLGDATGCQYLPSR